MELVHLITKKIAENSEMGRESNYLVISNVMYSYLKNDLNVEGGEVKEVLGLEVIVLDREDIFMEVG